MLTTNSNGNEISHMNITIKYRFNFQRNRTYLVMFTFVIKIPIELIPLIVNFLPWYERPHARTVCRSWCDVLDIKVDPTWWEFDRVGIDIDHQTNVEMLQWCYARGMFSGNLCSLTRMRKPLSDLVTRWLWEHNKDQSHSCQVILLCASIESGCADIAEKIRTSLGITFRAVISRSIGIGVRLHVNSFEWWAQHCAFDPNSLTKAIEHAVFRGNLPLLLKIFNKYPPLQFQQREWWTIPVHSRSTEMCDWLIANTLLSKNQIRGRLMELIDSNVPTKISVKNAKLALYLCEKMTKKAFFPLCSYELSKYDNIEDIKLLHGKCRSEIDWYEWNILSVSAEVTRLIVGCKHDKTKPSPKILKIIFDKKTPQFSISVLCRAFGPIKIPAGKIDTLLDNAFLYNEVSELDALEQCGADVKTFISKMHSRYSIYGNVAKWLHDKKYYDFSFTLQEQFNKNGLSTAVGSMSTSFLSWWVRTFIDTLTLENADFNYALYKFCCAHGLRREVGMLYDKFPCVCTFETHSRFDMSFWIKSRH